jgi:hypothetical protein
MIRTFKYIHFKSKIICFKSLKINKILDHKRFCFVDYPIIRLNEKKLSKLNYLDISDNPSDLEKKS